MQTQAFLRERMRTSEAIFLSSLTFSASTCFLPSVDGREGGLGEEAVHKVFLPCSKLGNSWVASKGP